MSKRKTWTAKAADLRSDWYVVDATDQVLGHLASGVAAILRGKHKPTFTPHLNSGDHVVVINAAKVKVTGGKLDTKEYTRYTGYPGDRHATQVRRHREGRRGRHERTGRRDRARHRPGVAALRPRPPRPAQEGR